MKKILLFMFFIIAYIYTNFIFADSGTSTLSRNNNNTECPLTTSHGLIHYGVPSSNITSLPSSGSMSCITHTYYNSSDYEISFIYNGGVTACPTGERVVAWNQGTHKITCRKYDDIPPIVGNILDSTPSNNSHLLATNSKNFSFDISNAGGSPIISKKVFFENYNTTDSYNASSNECVTGCNINISNVDNDRETNGSRIYKARVTKICDEAGNCVGDENSLTSLKDFNYNVYANTNNVGTASVTTNNLTSSTNIADGTVKNLSITLKDTYGNQIVPATGINRTIDFNWNYSNLLFLNQFNRTGNSVFLTSSNGSSYSNLLPNGNGNSNSLNNQSSTGGTYNYKFKIYTPTSNQNNGPISDSSAVFNVSSITYDINGSLGNTQNNTVGSSNFNAKFSPMYYTSITGDIKDGGLISNITQKSKIIGSKNGSANPASGPTLQLYFTGSSSNLFNLYHKISNSTYGTADQYINKLNLTNAISDIPFNSYNNYLSTKLMQIPGTVVPSSSNTVFSTHISYTLDGHDIVTNSDLVGRDSFWSGNDNSTFQAGLKINGLVYSDKTKVSNIVEGQSFNILGNDTKSSVGVLSVNQKTISKTKILESAYSFMKNVAPGNQSSPKIDKLNGDINLNGKTITYSNSGSIIYFKNPSSIVTLENPTNPIEVKGKRTILVVGQNLYIKSNLYYANSKSILGIIVIGGNIYIDPGVTNIVGTLFTDKSILSYKDGELELDPDDDLFTLKNQLHIYGNIISENTIGGSNKTTPKCPPYLNYTSIQCTQQVAQKYDLNFLRRYFITTNGYPFNSGKVSGGGNFGSSLPFDYYLDSDLSGKVYTIINKTDKYFKYPVIIEYNSLINSNPPPLFKQ